MIHGSAQLVGSESVSWAKERPFTGLAMFSSDRIEMQQRPKWIRRCTKSLLWHISSSEWRLVLALWPHLTAKLPFNLASRIIRCGFYLCACERWKQAALRRPVWFVNGWLQATTLLHRLAWISCPMHVSAARYSCWQQTKDLERYDTYSDDSVAVSLENITLSCSKISDGSY